MIRRYINWRNRDTCDHERRPVSSLVLDQGRLGDALGGWEVGPGARWGVDGDGDVLLQSGVAGGVVGGVVLPAAPDDPAPGATEGA
jgi:hypothetical protein